LTSQKAELKDLLETVRFRFLEADLSLSIFFLDFEMLMVTLDLQKIQNKMNAKISYIGD
jgi:hypothetical protein